MHADDLTLELADPAATERLGAALAPALEPDMVLWLHGDLGAGKTALVRALLRARGVSGPVKSPSYNLVEVHPVSGINLYHFDFYRFNQPEEYLDAGLDEYFATPGLRLVEWPEKAAPYVPSADLEIWLAIAGTGRRARLVAHGARGRACLKRAATLPGGVCLLPQAPG